MVDAIAAKGTLIQIGDGGSPETFTTIAKVNQITGPSPTEEFIDVTSLDSTSGYREFLPSFKDGGEVSLEVSLVPTTHNDLQSKFEAQTIHNFKIVWPDAGSSTVSFAAYVQSIAPTAQVGDKVGATITLRVSGAVTWA